MRPQKKNQQDRARQAGRLAVVVWALGLTLLSASGAEAGPAPASAADTSGSEPASTLAAPVARPAADAEPASPYLSDWYHQQVQFIGSYDIRYGPFPVNDIYLEYEFSGTKGPFDLYGYLDFNKIFNVGSHYDSGVWDGDGSPFFTELEPKMSIDRLFGRDLGIGPVKEWFLATDYILDFGQGKDTRQNVLYFGPGAAIDTHSPVNLEFNFFWRRQFANYGAANTDSWDGYRLQGNMAVPLGTVAGGGNLLYVGFVNYDFGSDLGKQPGSPRTDYAVVDTNVLILSYTHLRYFFAARYFRNGGQWRDGAVVDFGDGPQRLDENGWGYYLALGWQF